MKTTKQRRKERTDHRFRVQFHSVERVEFFRLLPSEISGEQSNWWHRGHGCDNAHMRSRGAGGTYLDIVPLIRREHHDLDTFSGAVFKKKYGRTKQSVRDRAEHYANLWETRHE